MAVAPRTRVVCPRCASPVTGDFKYCPACACRLKAGTPDPSEAPRARPSPWAWALGLGMAALVAGLVVVGVALFEERAEPPAEGPRSLAAKRSAIDLTVLTLPACMVRVGEGVADWVSVEEDGQAVLRERWTRPLQVMAFEVTRRLYAEYLTALAERVRAGRGPGPGLERIWHAGTEAERAYAQRYLAEWVEAWLRLAATRGLARADALEPLLAYVPEGQRSAGLTASELALRVPFPWPDDLGLLVAAPPAWAYLSTFGLLLSLPMPAGTDQLPVTGVAWTDALAFAAWAREELGGGLPLRLPVEGEWQRIAHSGEPPPPSGDEERVGRAWPWGNEPLLRACNNAQLWPDGATPRLQPVDLRYLDEDDLGRAVSDETDDGVVGMAGNAREWTLTDQPPLKAGSRYWVNWRAEQDAMQGRAATRGGSYLRGIYECTVQRRTEEPKAARLEDVGFRLVADAVL